MAVNKWRIVLWMFVTWMAPHFIENMDFIIKAQTKMTNKCTKAIIITLCKVRSKYRKAISFKRVTKETVTMH